jgi:hypothetical protein
MNGTPIVSQLSINLTMKSSSYYSVEQLHELFGEVLATGQCVVVAHHQSSEEGCVRIELAQQRTLSDSNRPAMSSWQKSFARRSPAVVRAWQTMVADAASELAVGETVIDTQLRIVDQLVAPYVGAKPRLTKEGSILVNSEGLPIYRTIVPSFVDEDYADHIIAAQDSGEEWIDETE